MHEALSFLKLNLEGELFYDQALRTIYATDASVYRNLPLAVAYPKHVKDLQTIINFVRANKLSIIPRGAGTSLAGQCVGEGIVVDVSKYMNRILEVNEEEKWVRVEPGVVRDDLNRFLKGYNLFFGPNTSTANRCTIGGMVGNNSSGTTSIEYGTTRDHVMELEVVLSDGSLAIFNENRPEADTFQHKIFRETETLLSDPFVQKDILEKFPKETIHRRNTGYALDTLILQKKMNLSALLCGSEGTLAMTVSIKLKLDPLPKPLVWVVCPHFTSISDAMRATLLAMDTKPSACELMDKTILDCTKGNPEQTANRFFVEGDPAAILMIEYRADSEAELDEKTHLLINTFRDAQLGYSFPIVKGKATAKVWALRAAGLGLLANLPGDPKAVACIEDTAVALEDLPAYIDEFGELMKNFGQKAVYYAHAGAGEIHLRPILDLKKEEDVRLFYEISLASAKLVKKYNGSLSGEHGDGRVRAGFIPMMVGEANYQRFKFVKKLWDPENIFNPGKIVDAEPMTESLRYEPGQQTRDIETMFDFSDTLGIQRAVEKCNGSGDCRKSAEAGGTMCPSYMATRDETDTTRARANMLREAITHDDRPFESEDAKNILDLCLSCKGCSSECPSNVNMTILKAEFMYHYQEANGYSSRSRLIVRFAQMQKLAALVPGIYNKLMTQSGFSKIFKKWIGFAPERSLPAISQHTVRNWLRKNPGPKASRKVYLFIDEFINWNEAHVGITTIKLLRALGFEVLSPLHEESGRAHLSKGFLKEAKALATKNVDIFQGLVSEEIPLIGIEPSAILSFRDEYPLLVADGLKNEAKQIAKNTFTIDEFLYQLLLRGDLKADLFDKKDRILALHGHCHQKALSKIEKTIEVLSVPIGHHVQHIPSGCCGMAGSFGYEAEHFELSQKIGELVLFPTVRALPKDAFVIATGVSCRHQILDGVQRKALHPVEILWLSMVKY